MLKKDKKNLVYLFILLVPFFLFFVWPHSFTSVKFGFVKIVSFPIRLLSVPFHEIKKIVFYHHTYAEYKRLSKEVDVLRSRLTGLEEVIRENTRLEALLEFKRQLLYSSVVANVVGRDPSHWSSSMIIDKGEEDGVHEGLPVVSAVGVVGKIAEVGRATSKVILLTDPQFSVAALVQRPRESGVVSGTLQGKMCRLRYINENADVQIGDKVITSKLSSSFPEGLLIGEILRVERDPKKPTVSCLVEPAVSFSQIEEVLVILH